MGMFGLLRESRTLSLPLLLAAGTLLLRAQPVTAQEAAPAEPPLMARDFKEYPSDQVMAPAKARGLEIKIMQMINAGVFADDQQQKDFDDYFKFKIAELTWAANRADLPKKIGDLKRQRLIPAGKTEQKQVHDRLNQLFLVALSNFASDKDYHPAVRFNCVMLLGNLDQVEPEIANPAPIGLPAALDKLLALVADAKQPDYIRVAAMNGIKRHASSLSPNSMTAKGRADTVKVLTAPITLGNPEATAWARRLAARTLGYMAFKWPEANKPEVVALSQQLMDDKEATLLERCDGARALSAIDKAGFANAAITKLASSAGQVAADLGKSAADPRYKWVDDPGPGKTASLQYLTHQFLCVHSAIKGVDDKHGLLVAAPNDAKAFLNELASKINELADICSNKAFAVDVAQSKLAEKGEQLEQWIKTKNNGAVASAAGAR